MKDDLFCPINIEFVTKNELEEVLLSYNEGSSISLIVSKDMSKWLKLTNVIDGMASRYDFTWLDENYANPTHIDVINGVKKIGTKPEKLICIGGGSAIDLGKGISALFDYISSGNDVPDDVSEYIQARGYADNANTIPIIAIPTTAGTGSEVTKWATIWDTVSGKKLSVDMNALYPAQSLVCTELTMTAPKKLMVSTALDAMSHAMESFWAKQTNPLIQDIAMMAVSKIHKYLPLAVQKPDDYYIRSQLCRASILAGVAFSNTRTTASHSISYPMTMMFGVDHGFAVILTIAQVAKINMSALPEITELLAIFESDGGLQEWLDKVTHDIQTLRLSAFGIEDDDIDKLVEASFTAGRMNNNPVDISKEQVRQILSNIL